LIHSESLRNKVQEMVRMHPWYGRLLADGGVVPVDGHWELEQLPFVTAPILESFYYSHPPQSECPLSVYHTSGTSSGKRKSIYYTEQDDQQYIDIKTQVFGDWLRNSPILRAMADMGTGHAAHTALAIFERLGLEGESLSFELPIERHIERLESFRPDLLYTMPSILDHIVSASPAPSVYGIKKIILVGEIATLEWRRKMASLLGIAPGDILDTYGSIEIGTIAYYSHDHGKYLFVDGLFAEGIGSDQLQEGYEPLQDNEKVLVLTSFVRTAFPALRYVTYDVVRDLQTIEVDGALRQSFTCIAKRIGPELKHGEKISIYDIEDVVYSFLDDAEVRVKLQDNVLAVHIRSKSLDGATIPLIQSAIEGKIPEIGTMIRNRMLGAIEVIAADDHETFTRRRVKNKKLYY
jgi:phenylacetate-coenzyme A ligase PaaK-like adenylate-forming protein